MDAEDDILLNLESDTWSTEVYNGSAGSPSEELFEEYPAEVFSSPEPSSTPINNLISAGSMITEITERAARLETMLEEDGPSLFGIERLRHASSSSISMQQDKKTETNTGFFGKDYKSDELVLNGYARTNLTVFPVRQPVSNGENKPWRVVDGREATQPQRRMRQNSIRSPNYPRAQSTNSTSVSRQNKLALPSTSEVGSQNTDNAGFSQSRLTSNRQPLPSSLSNHSAESLLTLPTIPGGVQMPISLSTRENSFYQNHGHGTSHPSQSALYNNREINQPRLEQTRSSTADFYWHQDREFSLHSANASSFYSYETPQLNINPGSHSGGSENNMGYTDFADGDRTLDNTTFTSTGPFHFLQAINPRPHPYPHPYPHASFGDRNVQNGAIERNISSLPQRAESGEEGESNVRRHISEDGMNTDNEPYNPYSSNESEIPFAGSIHSPPLYQQPHLSAAHFHPPAQTLSPPSRENLLSDFHVPMSAEQGVQDEVTPLSTNQVELTNGELQIEAPEPWDMKDLLHIEDSEE